MKITSRKIRYFSLIAAILFALPLSFGVWTGLYLWTSPNLMINTIVAIKTVPFFHIISVIILGLIIWKRRWYCKWACPMGVICDAASKGRSKIKLQQVPYLNQYILLIGLILALLGSPLFNMIDPMSIFHSFFTAFKNQTILAKLLQISGLVFLIILNVIIPHIWCQKLCPLGGLQDFITILKSIVMPKKSRKPKSSTTRRAFLAGVLGIGGKLLFSRMGYAQQQPVIRPPGAIDKKDFTATCCRCGNCIKACPTDIIVQQTDPSDITELLTPMVKFTPGYCLPECNVCGVVCPTSSIHPFTKKQKAKLVMGMAKINVNECLLLQHKECDLCKKYCAFKAVAISSRDFGLVAQPAIITDLCVGCGACQVVCPPQVIKILPKI